MPPALFKPAAKPLSGRYLSLAEREEIALLLVQGHSLREIGCRLGRSASTISLEIRRNATTRGGRLDYRATLAQWHAVVLPHVILLPIASAMMLLVRCDISCARRLRAARSRRAQVAAG